MPDNNDLQQVPSPVSEQSEDTPHTLMMGHGFAMQVQSHEGPLPSPAVLKAYEAICPGAMDRILQLAEREQHYRLECEQQALSANIDDAKAERAAERRGQWQAFALCFASIASGVILALLGQPIPGSLLAGATMLGVAAVFITRKFLPSKTPE